VTCNGDCGNTAGTVTNFEIILYRDTDKDHSFTTEMETNVTVIPWE